MISELSEEAQYICTTFRAELIPHADAFFGVVFISVEIGLLIAVRTHLLSS